MVKVLVASVLGFATTAFAVRPVEPPAGQQATEIDSHGQSFLEETQAGYDDPMAEESVWNPLQAKSEHLEKTYELLTQQRLKVQGAVSHEKLNLKKLETDLGMYRMMHKATLAQEDKLRQGQSETLLKMFHTMYEGSQAGAKEVEGSAKAVESEQDDEEPLPQTPSEELSTPKPEESNDEAPENTDNDEMGSPEKDKLIRNVEQADSTGGTFTGSGMPVVDKEIDNKRDMNEVVSEIKGSTAPHEHLASSDTNGTEVEVADQVEDESLGMDTHSDEHDQGVDKSGGGNDDVTDEVEPEVNSSVVQIKTAHQKKAHAGVHRARDGQKSRHHDQHHGHHSKETTKPPVTSKHHRGPHRKD
mmetsp:Transcript_2488/g.6234  ORF Transcript_2488/g.6234 Transcript_2488/m.6234 type:complete len:358 (+) Transcript_2488:102-1175(+)